MTTQKNWKNQQDCIISDDLQQLLDELRGVAKDARKFKFVNDDLIPFTPLLVCSQDLYKVYQHVG